MDKTFFQYHFNTTDFICLLMFLILWGDSVLYSLILWQVHCTVGGLYKMCLTRQSLCLHSYKHDWSRKFGTIFPDIVTGSMNCFGFIYNVSNKTDIMFAFIQAWLILLNYQSWTYWSINWFSLFTCKGFGKTRPSVGKMSSKTR